MSYISLGISVVALIISLVTISQSKKEAFHSTVALIASMKQNYLEMYALHNSNYDKDSDAKYVIEEAAANYINSVEIACALYLNNGINKKLFKIVLKDELEIISRTEGVASFLSIGDMDGSNDVYKNIRLVSKELGVTIK